MSDRSSDLIGAAKVGRNYKSTFCRFDMQKKSQHLWVFCSHVGIPAGKFAQTRVGRNFYGDKLYFNCPDNNWYQNGVPEIAETLQQIAQVVQMVAESRSRQSVFIVGHSMGAYLAILLGKLVPNSRYLAISPETVLGLAGSRSERHNVRDGESLNELLERHSLERPPQAEPQNGLILYGVFDPVDAYFLQDESVVLGRFGLVREVFWHHGITEYLNGRGFYLDFLRDFSSAESLSKVSPDLLFKVGTHGSPSEYREFYRSMTAMLKEDINTAISIANRMGAWENPGWQHHRSTIYYRGKIYPEAYEASKMAFSGAPHVYEHAIQLGKSAMACQDWPNLRALLHERPKGSYNHSNYDRFVEYAQGVMP